VKLTVSLVLVEWSAGVLCGLVLVHALYRVGPGFTWLLGLVATAVTALGAVAGRNETGRAAGLRTGLAGAMALVGCVQVVQARRPRLAVEVSTVGLAAAAAVAAGLAAGGGASAVARSVSGAAFLGAVTDGMVVGHWYLIDPRLPRSVIRRITWVFLGTVVLEAGLLAAPRGMVAEIIHSHRTGVGAVLPGFWVALVLLTAVLGLAVLGTLREPTYAGVMAATGLLYLSVVTAFGVDVLAKALISRAI
jgi:hypothetical protein